MEHIKWFERTTDNASALAASKNAVPPLNNATLSRQINKGTFSPEVVIAIARGYNQSPVEALAQTGYLRTEEAVGQRPEAIAQLLSDQDLIRELARRVDDNAAAWTDTFDGTIQKAQEPDEGEDDLAARRAFNAERDAAQAARAEDDLDALIDRINSGEEEVAAQRATEPLEEHWT